MFEHGHDSNAQLARFYGFLLYIVQKIVKKMSHIVHTRIKALFTFCVVLAVAISAMLSRYITVWIASAYLSL